MKVKELIAQLQELDQEREIHIVYDTFFVYSPEFEEAEEDFEYNRYAYKKGDYVMFVG